jgi:hypothetical protein
MLLYRAKKSSLKFGAMPRIPFHNAIPLLLPMAIAWGELEVFDGIQ